MPRIFYKILLKKAPKNYELTFRYLAKKKLPIKKKAKILITFSFCFLLYIFSLYY